MFAVFRNYHKFKQSADRLLMKVKFLLWLQYKALLNVFRLNNRPMSAVKHKIKLPDGRIQIIRITSAWFKSWHVWIVRLDNGQAAMLFKMGSEWMQRHDDFLDAPLLDAVGKRIDRIIFHRSKLAL